MVTKALRLVTKALRLRTKALRLVTKALRLRTKALRLKTNALRLENKRASLGKNGLMAVKVLFFSPGRTGLNISPQFRKDA